MENATKALLIAAGIFFAILIISLLLVFYNDISAYYQQKSELTVVEQAQEFNAKFENYHRDNIRGSDLISLMNRVIDYNATESYFVDKSYERIKVTITLGEEDIRRQFKYDTTDTTSLNECLNSATITNVKNNGDVWQNDRELVAITNTSTELCKELSTLRVKNPTDNQLQQLSSNISNIILADGGEDKDWAISYRFKRAEIIEDLLGIKINVNSTTGKTNSDSESTVNKIKEITSQYFQYMQFKRAYFNCTEVIYDTETNRVEEMKFELQIKNGMVVFDQ